MKAGFPGLGDARSEYADFTQEPGGPEEMIPSSSADFLVLLNVLDEASGDGTALEPLHRMLDKSFDVVKPGGYLVFSSIAGADHPRLEETIEEYATAEGVSLKKVWTGHLDSARPQATAYLLKSKLDNP